MKLCALLATLVVLACASVAVFLEEPTKAYQSIALIEVSDQSWGLSLASLSKKMRSEAAKLGGDGVIIGRPSTTSAGLIPIGNSYVAAEEKKLVGKVIIFTSPPHQ